MKEFFEFIETNSLKELFIDSISKLIITFTFATAICCPEPIMRVISFMAAFYMIDYCSYYKYLNSCGKL